MDYQENLNHTASIIWDNYNAFTRESRIKPITVWTGLLFFKNTAAFLLFTVMYIWSKFVPAKQTQACQNLN